MICEGDASLRAGTRDLTPNHGIYFRFLRTPFVDDNFHDRKTRSRPQRRTTPPG